jgi:3-dehydroquinate dehydratase/shikimate dehydrogenase
MSTDQRRICVSICERDVTALTTAIRSGAEIGDLVEVRLDCFSERDLPSAIAELRTLLQHSSLSTIITLRPLDQGGLRSMDLDYRLQFWREHGFQLPATFFDLEIDLAELLVKDGETKVDWSRVICSFHDFNGGYGDLESLYERLARTPARTLKIAVSVDEAVNNLDLFELLARARSEGRELIAVGMGTAGIATRVLGPSRGSFLTYGALNRSSPTAPGQPTASELRDQYRVDQINDATQVMGLIGCPISHSLSPQVHNAAFRKEALNGCYIPFEVRDLASFMRRMVYPRTREMNWNLRGLSVTAPHKRAVMECLDWIDPAAREIDAVNTIVIDEASLKGYNTDAMGFICPLKERLGDLQNARCAVIGGGGAARAAIWALLQEGAAVTAFVRNLGRAKALTERFAIGVTELRDSSFDGFDVVVNATVLGMADGLEQQTPASAQQLRGARLAYDLVYNPIETRFLREARGAGCQTMGGLPMFVTQAAEQFRLWMGSKAPMEVMQAAAMEALIQ